MMFTTDVSLIATFAAGVISFASPCVLPVVPVYVAILAGSAADVQGSSRQVVGRTLCFLAGFTTVFLLMGGTASLLGQLFMDYRDVLRQVGAVFMMVMGLQLAGVFQFHKLQQEWHPWQGSQVSGPLGAVVLGLTVAAGWTPCIGPILASVLTYAGTETTLAQGIVLLLAYSAGFALPFLAVAMAVQRYSANIRAWYRWLPYLQKGSGLLLVLTGGVLFFNQVPRLLGILAGSWY
jgi:cytochrome c-type biogenesis protein